MQNIGPKLYDDRPTDVRRARDRDYDDRPSEDDVAQACLGGTRGAPELEPAPMTRQRRIKTSEHHTEPGSGHTA